MKEQGAKDSQHYPYLFWVLFFGSLWGVLEATLGGALHIIGFPYKGEIMANFGFMIMAAGVAATGWIELPMGTGLIASAMKTVDALLFSVPITSRFIMNPVIAIMLESMALQIAMLLFRKPFLKRVETGFLIGGSGMLLSVAASSSVFFLLLRRGPGFTTGFGEVVRFIMLHGSIASVAAALTTPLGTWIGQKTRESTTGLLMVRTGTLRQRISVTARTSVIILCWVLTVIHPFK